MARVTRLFTAVDINDADDDGSDARRMSVTARHEALLEDGRRVVLLDDRGWSGQLGAYTDDGSLPRDWRERSPSIWMFETVEGLEQTARIVVGPDEPFDALTQAEVQASHWEGLATVLREQGVDVDAAGLKELPHDVQLSTRLRERIGHGRGD
jgi:hypothetical protein